MKCFDNIKTFYSQFELLNVQHFIQHHKNGMLDEILDWFDPALRINFFIFLKSGKTVISNFLADATESAGGTYHPTQGVRYVLMYACLQGFLYFIKM